MRANVATTYAPSWTTAGVSLSLSYMWQKISCIILEIKIISLIWSETLLVIFNKENQTVFSLFNTLQNKQDQDVAFMY